MATLFSNLSEEKVRTYGLVLEACGVVHQVRSCGHLWCIDVPVAYRSVACRAISKYLKENAPGLRTAAHPPFLKGQRSWSAAFAVMPLVVIHWAIAPGEEFQAFISGFGADAGLIVSGSLYRCVTALLLHSDWAHLLSNAVALTLFGTALAYTIGWGVAWLLILLSGAGGNLLAALWYGPGHISVGASTAVFAAVGLCAAVSFWQGIRARAWSWRQWTPLAGGLALMGMLGAAPHTDLVGHMMGFVSGLAAGLLWAWRRPSAPWPVQLAAASLLAGLVISCWVWGLGYNG